MSDVPRPSAELLPPTRSLLVSHHRHRDAAAREALVHRYLPLARHLARRYRGHSQAFDDLNQVAAIGLLKAIDRFDPSRGTAFSTYATPTIIGELKRHFRDTGWAVHVPRGLQELALDVSRAAEALEREHGHPPTPARIAERTGISADRVHTAYDVMQARYGVPFELDEDGEDARMPVGSNGTIDDGFRAVEDAATLETLASAFGDREREVLRLRFSEDLKQSDIALRVGVSQMQISRILRRVTERLREAPGAGALLDA